MAVNNSGGRRERVLKRILSMLTAAALTCAASIVTASAQATGAASVKAVAGAAVTGPGAEAGAGLKADMLKLVAEARTSRAGQAPPPRRRPVQNHGFSTGQKVAIGVGAAAAVILVIILSRRGDSDKFIAPPCPPGQLCL